MRQAAERIHAAVRDFHSANPQRAGEERDVLLATTGLTPELFDLAVEGLVAQKRLAQTGAILSLSEWKAKLPDADERLCGAVAAAYKKAGWSSPTSAELSSQLQAPLDRIEKVVRLLTDRRILVRLDPRVIMHADAIAAAQQIVLRLFRAAPSFSTMQFRDALNVSRKFAVPLLDYLDTVRFTVRSGHDRTPGVEAKRRLQSGP